VLVRKGRSPILAVFRRPDAEALGVEWRVIDYE